MPLCKRCSCRPVSRGRVGAMGGRGLGGGRSKRRPGSRNTLTHARVGGGRCVQCLHARWSLVFRLSWSVYGDELKGLSEIVSIFEQPRSSWLACHCGTGCVRAEHTYWGTSCRALTLEVGKSPTEVPPGMRLPVIIINNLRCPRIIRSHFKFEFSVVARSFHVLSPLHQDCNNSVAVFRLRVAVVLLRRPRAHVHALAPSRLDASRLACGGWTAAGSSSRQGQNHVACANRARHAGSRVRRCIDGPS